MDVDLLREWKRKLTPQLSAIRVVNGVGFGQFGLRINLTQDDPQAREAIEAIFERECPDLPYIVKVVGKIQKQYEQEAGQSSRTPAVTP